MKIQHGILAGVVIALWVTPAIAQTTTGANSSITLPTPPRPMASMPVPSTPGVDSTYQGNVQPNVQGTTTLTVPWTYSGSGTSSATAAAMSAATVKSRPLPKHQSAAAASQRLY